MMPTEYFMNSTAKKEGGRGEERGGERKNEIPTVLKQRYMRLTKWPITFYYCKKLMPPGRRVCLGIYD